VGSPSISSSSLASTRPITSIDSRVPCEPTLYMAAICFTIGVAMAVPSKRGTPVYPRRNTRRNSPTSRSTKPYT
jgi:hypothetical protein